MEKQDLKEAAMQNSDGSSRVAQQISLEDRVKDLESQLDWHKLNEKQWKRGCKKTAFDLASTLHPDSSDTLIVDAIKIYKELIK